MKKSFLVFFILLFISVACQDDRNNIENGTATGEQEVEFNLTAPVTYSSVSDDEKVLELDLVVCKDGEFQYMRSAYASDYATFRSILKIDPNVDIYFFANCRSALDTVNILTVGRDWEDIRKDLIITNTTTKIGSETVLPMWGRVTGVSISEKEVNKINGIQLLRPVASANVYFDLTEGKGLKFTPKVAYIYFGADKAFIAPEKGIIISQGDVITGVSKPLSPSGMKTIKVEEAQAVGTNFENSLYMFDNDSDVDSTDPDSRYTRVVVGGELEGTSGYTYYPLDFRDKDNAPDKRIRVTRNQQYNITVTSVNSEGWSTPDEAAEHASVNLEYGVVTWEQMDDENIYVDGPNYVSIEKRTVDLARNKNVRATLSLATSYSADSFKFEFVDDVTTPFKDEYGNVGAEGKYYQIVVVKNQNGDFDALNVYSKYTFDTNPLPTIPIDGDYRKKQEVWVICGRIKFKISITQTDRSPSDWEKNNQEIDL